MSSASTISGSSSSLTSTASGTTNKEKRGHARKIIRRVLEQKGIKCMSPVAFPQPGSNTLIRFDFYLSPSRSDFYLSSTNSVIYLIQENEIDSLERRIKGSFVHLNQWNMLVLHPSVWHRAEDAVDLFLSKLAFDFQIVHLSAPGVEWDKSESALYLSLKEVKTLNGSFSSSSSSSSASSSTRVKKEPLDTDSKEPCIKKEREESGEPEEERRFKRLRRLRKLSDKYDNREDEHDS